VRWICMSISSSLSASKYPELGAHLISLEAKSPAPKQSAGAQIREFVHLGPLTRFPPPGLLYLDPIVVIDATLELVVNLYPNGLARLPQLVHDQQVEGFEIVS
jgi:hypothetical protein